MSLDKEIEKLYKESPLEDENWLELGEDFYANIDRKINAKPRKRRVIIFWILGALLGLLLLWLTVSAYKTTEGASIAETSMTSQHLSQGQVIANESTKIEPDTKSQLSKDTQDRSISQALEGSQVRTSKQTISKIQKSSQRYNEAIQESKGQLFSDVVNDTQHLFSDIKGPLEVEEPTVPSVTSNSNKHQHMVSAGQKISGTALESKKHLNVLPQLSAELEKHRSAFVIHQKPKFVDVTPTSVTPWSISFGVGFIAGDITLNPEYELALEPAAFRNSNYEGVEVTGELSRTLSESLSAYSAIHYGKVSFTSGHNAEYNYNVSTESEMSNVVNLSMATPLGFVPSELTITRENLDNAGGQMVIDLHNQHDLTEIAGELGVKCQVLRSDVWSVLLSGGFGRRYTTRATNTLSKVDLSSSDFSYTSSNGDQDPTFYNAGRNYYLLGGEAKRSLGPSVDIGVQVNYRQQITNIYQQDGFSASMHDLKALLFAQKRF